MLMSGDINDDDGGLIPWFVAGKGADGAFLSIKMFSDADVFVDATLRGLERFPFFCGAGTCLSS